MLNATDPSIVNEAHLITNQRVDGGCAGSSTAAGKGVLVLHGGSTLEEACNFKKTKALSRYHREIGR